MKHSKLADAAIVAALLLAYIPGLAEDVLPEAAPGMALIAPAPEESAVTQEDPAHGL